MSTFDGDLNLLIVKKLLPLLLIIIIAAKADAQNLVMNPSFEDTIPCSIYWNTGAPYLPCTNWKNATIGSPDYYSSAYGCFFNSVPNNSFGFQNAENGIAYVGFCTYANWNYLYREYVEGKLTDTLKNGHTYCVSFYVSACGNTKYLTDRIGSFLSVDSIYNPDTAALYSYIPQVESPQGTILSDTINWILINGQFIAQGGEKYIIIGSFRNDTLTTLDSLPNATINNAAYYYMDDVSVIDCTVGIDDIKPNAIIFTITPNPARGEISISSSEEYGDKVELKIVDVLGRIIYSAKLLSPNSELSTINFPKGIYFVKLTSESVSEVKKLVVE